ncbi:hypothetical protein [Enterobacter roggenkampii]|uniref:helix-turn-helix transcriptional regulator n=1 Tax=Enterobacter roggenkampii TaxID=1812935 RepID=UPI002FF6A78B
MLHIYTDCFMTHLGCNAIYNNLKEPLNLKVFIVDSRRFNSSVELYFFIESCFFHDESINVILIFSDIYRPVSLDGLKYGFFLSDGIDEITSTLINIASMKESVKYLLRMLGNDTKISKLTSRQKEALNHLRSGLSLDEISLEMGITSKTLCSHLDKSRMIFKKPKNIYLYSLFKTYSPRESKKNDVFCMVQKNAEGITVMHSHICNMQNITSQ